MIEIKISAQSATELREHLRGLSIVMDPPVKLGGSDAGLLAKAEAAGVNPYATVEEKPATVEAQEEPKAKRGRKAAEKEPAPAPVPDEAPHAVNEEPEPSIRATPEDRQPVETVEEAVIVGTPSLDDLKAAMAKVQEARGMPWLVANVNDLLGAPRASAVAEGDRAAAIARLEEAARG